MVVMDTGKQTWLLWFRVFFVSKISVVPEDITPPGPIFEARYLGRKSGDGGENGGVGTVKVSSKSVPKIFV